MVSLEGKPTLDKARELIFAVADLGRSTPTVTAEAMEARDWKIFLRVAQQQRILGLAGQRLEGDVPSGVREALHRARHRTRLRALKAFREFDRIADAFRAHGIDCVPFKGVDLARRVYPDPGMRPFEDLDLLVRKEDVSWVCRVMPELGYRTPSSLLPVQLVRRFHFHLPFLHEDGDTFVEIHWRLADRGTIRAPHADLVERSATPPGIDRRVLPPDLYAAYLCAHIRKHGCLTGRIAHGERKRELMLHPWSELRLIWFIDLYRLLNHHGLTIEGILAVAEDLGCGAAAQDVLALCSLVFDRFPSLAQRLRPEREGALERRVKDRLMRHMGRDLDAQGEVAHALPWILRTNRRVHFRPIRLLGG